MSLSPRKVVLRNPKGLYNYTVEQEYIAGIQLEGCEVKSLRQAHGSLGEAYASLRGGEVFLFNLFIPPYLQSSHTSFYEARRDRKLLLRRHEIKRLAKSVLLKGKTLIPLELFFNNNGYAKVKIAVAFFKNRVDKREILKERSINIEKQRSFRL